MVGCGTNFMPYPPHWLNSVDDLKTFPQNLEVYANKLANKEQILLSSQAQEFELARFKRIFFAPWQMQKSSKKISDLISPIAKPYGYKYADQPWTEADFALIRANLNLDSFPNRAQNAITVCPTNLRSVPTQMALFTKPTSNNQVNPFDEFQYSYLPPATPVFIAHISRDNLWYFIESATAAGWVRIENLAFTSQEFQEQWQAKNFITPVKDKLKLWRTETSKRKLNADIGTILPLVSKQKIKINAELKDELSQNNSSHKPSQNTKINKQIAKMQETEFYLISMPKRDADANAVLGEYLVEVSLVKPWPMLATPREIAKLGNELYGQYYGWGGMHGDRDCSATLRDLFAAFGLWLPRNSLGQSRSGRQIELTGSLANKEQTILAKAKPFFSLLWMRGHIMLYLGSHNGKPAIFHNIWGIRIRDNGDDNQRFVLGRAIISSINPGAELKNLYTEQTFSDRLAKITLLGEHED